MAPSKLRKAIGAVKDQTSIGLAKVVSSATIADLEVAVVKATRHQECPPDERHIREILHLTTYSRAFVSCCVNTIARRLDRTNNWVVALKALMLIQRLCTEDNPVYEQEISLANKRRTRLLNLSNFRNASRQSDAYHFAGFVRSYGLYLNEYLEFRKHKESEDVMLKATPVNEMKTETIFCKARDYMRLLERFLACRPTGAAKDNKLVQVALYQIVVESFQMYHNTTKFLEVLVNRFIELEAPNMVRVHEIFSEAATKYDELDALYDWCRTVGIVHTSECPDVEKISLKKLDMIGEFIREESAKDAIKQAEVSPTEEEPQQALNFSEALLLPKEVENDGEVEEEIKGVVQEETNLDKKEPKLHKVPDLLTIEVDESSTREPSDKMALILFDANKTTTNPKLHQVQDLLTIEVDKSSTQEPCDKMALTLFDASQTTTNPKGTTTSPPWEAFKEPSPGEDWESVLVRPSNHQSNQNTTVPVGINTLILYSMYQQGAGSHVVPPSGIMPMGNAGNMALGLTGTPPVMMGGIGTSTCSSLMNNNPFAASSLVATPPAYVQMPNLNMNQGLLAQEQLMWQQYQQRNGMPGQFGLANVQQNPYQFNMH